jgi:hypothetical protein
MHAFWGRNYSEHPMEWKQVFDEESSSKAYEEDQELTGFGFAAVKDQGSAIAYDSETGGPTKRYVHVVYGLGFVVTKEEMEDNQYVQNSKRRTQALAFSMRQTEEVVAANILNRAFNNSYTGGDGKEFLATDHPTVNGTQSNELPTAADLSEASIEDLGIQIMQARNSRGHRIAVMPRRLIIPTNLAFDAERIVKSSRQSGTANNDLNAIKSMGMFPDGITINHYLTDVDAWFVQTNVPNGLIRFTRRATEFGKDNDFDTENVKAKATVRFSVGWSDWRCLYGSPGA